MLTAVTGIAVGKQNSTIENAIHTTHTVLIANPNLPSENGASRTSLRPRRRLHRVGKA